MPAWVPRFGSAKDCSIGGSAQALSTPSGNGGADANPKVSEELGSSCSKATICAAGGSLCLAGAGAKWPFSSDSSFVVARRLRSERGRR